MSGQGTGLLAAVLGDGVVPVGDGRIVAHRPSVPLTLLAAVAVWLVALAAFYISLDAGLISAAKPTQLVAGNSSFELLEDASLGDYGYSAAARTWVDGISYDVQLVYGADDVAGDARLFAHERVEGHVTYRAFSRSSFERYASEGLVARATLTYGRRQEASGAFWLVVTARRWAVGVFDEFSGQGAALLRALVIGDRSQLETDGLYDSVKVVGLAHMVAVSGAHLSVVAAFASALLSRSRLPRRFMAAVLCALYAAYAVFTGCSAPVIRAALMASVVVLAIFGKRKSSASSALGACVCVLIALHPANALSLSFFLSAASTLGIVLLSPLLQGWFGAVFSRRAPALSEACALTTAANIPIAPVTMCVFCRVPLLSPIANLVATPVFTVLLGGGLASLLAVAVAGAVAMPLVGFMARLAGLFCDFVRVLASVPYASFPCGIGMAPAVVATCVLVLGLWACWPRPRVWLGRALVVALPVLVGLAIAVLPSFASDELVMLDVGQGDAILLKSQGAALLVDTGNQDALLASALSRNGCVNLNGLVVTHHDDDHCGSLSVAAPLLAAGRVYVASDTFSCGCDSCEDLQEEVQRTCGSAPVGLAVGDVLRVGRFTCFVVWPQTFSDEGGNADSLCLLVCYDANDDGTWESTALLTGDAEAEQLQNLADSEVLVSAGASTLDIVKAGHHGSKAGITEELAAQLHASMVLISCGENNSYGHPALATLQAYQAVDTQIFRTDTQGDVRCRFEGDGIQVFTQKA